MRFLLKVNIPVETGNAAAEAGTLGTKIQSILTDLKPEAAYFTDNNGQRHRLLVSRHAGSFADPCDRGAVVSGVQCQHRDSPGHGASRPRQGRERD